MQAEPQVEEKWIEEGELELWDIRNYRDRIDRERNTPATRRQAGTSIKVGLVKYFNLIYFFCYFFYLIASLIVDKLKGIKVMCREKNSVDVSTYLLHFPTFLLLFCYFLLLFC